MVEPCSESSHELRSGQDLSSKSIKVISVDRIRFYRAGDDITFSENPGHGELNSEPSVNHWMKQTFQEPASHLRLILRTFDEVCIGREDIFLKYFGK